MGLKKFIGSRDDFFLVAGSSNTYFIKNLDGAICFDPGDHIGRDTLKELGISRLEAVFLTSPDRLSCLGLLNITPDKIFAGEGALAILENSFEYLTSDRPGRYDMVDFEPDKYLLPVSIKGAQSVEDGFEMLWKGWNIKAVATPGLSSHSLSYHIEGDGSSFLISGKNFTHMPMDLFLLQHERRGKIRGYHGFMERAPLLYESLETLSKAAMLLPSKGDIILSPEKMIHEFIARLKELYFEYAKTSALNYYFPDLLNISPLTSQPRELPDFVEHIPKTTSFAVKSASGHCFLVDMNYRDSLNWPEDRGYIPDFVWISHYHYDHVRFINEFVRMYGRPAYADESFSDILRNPHRYYLTCLSKTPFNVIDVKDGQKLSWHEFDITFYHFPGQTLYHGGLLLEGRGKKVFFSGDSLSPTGIDDYCAYNRNFLDHKRGFFHCLNMIKEIKPDIILNQHQKHGFSYTEKFIKELETSLERRLKILRSLNPSHPDLSFDPLAVRTKPYGVTVKPGGVFKMRVYFTGHGSEEVVMEAMPLLPDGFSLLKNTDPVTIKQSSGLDRDDSHMEFDILTSATATGKYVVLFDIRSGDKHLGPLCHFIVDVNP